MPITVPGLAQDVADLITKRVQIDTEFATWLSGPAGGGTGNDGKYPLTDYTGVSRLVESPDQLATGIGGSASAAAASAAAALASEQAAAASASAASTDEGLADAHRIAAISAQSAAETARDAALSAQSNAITHSGLAATSAANAAASETAAGISETNAAASEAAAAASAAAAATFDPALFAALADNETIAGQYTFNLITRFNDEIRLMTDTKMIRAGSNAYNYAVIFGLDWDSAINPVIRGFGGSHAVNPGLLQIVAPATGGEVNISAGTIRIDGDVYSSTKYANWDAAFGWGDHAGLYEPVDAEILRADTNDNITAVYTFTGSSQSQIKFNHGTGPTGIRWNPTGIPNTKYVDLVYRTTPEDLNFERVSDAAKILTLEPDTLRVITGTGGIYVPGGGIQVGTETMLQQDFTDFKTAFGWGDHSGLYANIVYEYQQTVADTRAVNSDPSAYSRVHRMDFKQRTLVDSPAGDPLYIGVHTIAPWSDSSGDEKYQVAYSNQAGVARLSIRTGLNSTWNAWDRIWSEGDFTATDFANWNTAFGWGDHGAAGYAPTASPSFTGTVGMAGQLLNTASASTSLVTRSTGGSASIELHGSTAAFIDMSLDGTGATDYGARIRYYSDYLAFEGVTELRIGSTPITTTLVGNWNTAFGWGDHAGLYAATSHTHAATDITSGTLSVARIRPTTHGVTAASALVEYNRFGSAVDMDTLREPGQYGGYAGMTNGPTGMTYDPIWIGASASDVTSQLVVPRTASRGLAWRGETSDVFTAWHYAAWTTTASDADLSLYSKTTHNHSGVYEPAFSKNTAFNDNYGTAAGTVCQGNDSRLSDARTPTATHSPGVATELSSSQDLNNLLAANAGFYYQTANADTTGNNYPNGHAGSLLVQKSAGQMTQLYITYPESGNKMFFRSEYNSGTPGSWHEVATRDEAQTFAGVCTFTSNLDVNGNIIGDGATTISGVETVTIDSTGDITKTSHGNYLYHQSTAYDNDQNGGVTFSTSAASGGTTGDIWFQYT